MTRWDLQYIEEGMMSRRTDRVGDLLRAELSDLILREVHDPRVQLATVSSVAVTADLRHAKVNVSVLGNDEEQRQEAILGLTHARGFLRSQLARRLRTRVAPELEFELDRGAEHSQQISDLIDNIQGDES